MRVKERWGAEVLASLQPADEAASGQPPASASAPPPALSHQPSSGPAPEVPLASTPPFVSVSGLKRVSSATQPPAKRAASRPSSRGDGSRPSSRASQGSQQPLFRARRVDSDAGRYTGVKTIPSGSYQAYINFTPPAGGVQRVSLGTFDNEHDAALAWDVANLFRSLHMPEVKVPPPNLPQLRLDEDDELVGALLATPVTKIGLVHFLNLWRHSSGSSGMRAKLALLDSSEQEVAQAEPATPASAAVAAALLVAQAASTPEEAGGPAAKEAAEEEVPEPALQLKVEPAAAQGVDQEVLEASNRNVRAAAPTAAPLPDELARALASHAGQDAGLTPDLVEKFSAAMQDIDAGRRRKVEAVLASMLGMGVLGAAAALMRDLL